MARCITVLCCDQESCQEFVKLVFVKTTVRSSNLAVHFPVSFIAKDCMTSFALEELHGDIGHIKDKDNFECVAKMTTLSGIDPHVASRTRYKISDILVARETKKK